MKNELTGKIALVTGGSRGIGRAAALALAKAGADVAVNFQCREAEAQAVCREIDGMGRRAVVVKADVSKAAEVARLVETVEKGLGGVDILVNNAGISRPQPLPVSPSSAEATVLMLELHRLPKGRNSSSTISNLSRWRLNRKRNLGC